MKSILVVMIFLLVACGHDESKNNTALAGSVNNFTVIP